MTRRVGSLAVLAAIGTYIVVPLVASARFSLEGRHGRLTLDAYTTILDQPAFWHALWLSVRIGLTTVLVELVLVTWTSLWVRLRSPGLAALVDAVVLIPIMVPVVVIVLGVTSSLRFLPQWLTETPAILVAEYALLALPYAYRIVDAGVGALDLATLTEAAHSLGAHWRHTVLQVLLPGLKGPLMAAGAMTIALCLGEYVMASLLSFTTFPVWLQQIGATQATEAVAVSTLALVSTVVVLAIVVLAAGRSRGPGVEDS
jgi:putative spermidine/putrescine transport system permease protein